VLGVFALLILSVLLAWCGYSSPLRPPMNPFGNPAVVGLTTLIVGQAASLHLCTLSACCHQRSCPLPLISYGGTQF